MNRRMLYFPLAAIVGLWIVLIFHFSSQTHGQQAIIPTMKTWISARQLSEHLPDVTIHYYHEQIAAKRKPFEFVDFIFRKSAHVFIYSMLGLISTLAANRLRVGKGWRVGLVLMLALGISLLDEWNQSRIPSRTGSNPFDVSLDVAAACIGLALGMLIDRGVKSGKPRRR